MTSMCNLCNLLAREDLQPGEEHDLTARYLIAITIVPSWRYISRLKGDHGNFQNKRDPLKQ